MISTQQELGERIADARAAAGFTQSDLASKLNLDRTAITKIESGDRKVDSFELARIAEVLRRPTTWFLMTRLPNVISRREARDGIERAADVDLEILAADVEQLTEMKLLHPVNWQLLDTAVESVDAAEEVAGLVRSQLGTLSDPIIDLVDHVERLGLYAFVLELEEEVEGTYLALESCGVALIHGSSNVGKRRFTLAHELGHHILQDDYSSEWVAGLDERERMISAFAIHFLAPRAGIKVRWDSLGGQVDAWNAAVHIAADFGLSWSAMTAHLRNLSFIDRDTFEKLRSQIPGRLDFLERGLTVHNSVPCPSLPPGFIAAVTKGYRHRKLSSARALELLRGVAKEEDLPTLHDVPLDAMYADFEPL